MVPFGSVARKDGALSKEKVGLLMPMTLSWTVQYWPVKAVGGRGGVRKQLLEESCARQTATNNPISCNLYINNVNQNAVLLKRTLQTKAAPSWHLFPSAPPSSIPHLLDLQIICANYILFQLIAYIGIYKHGEHRRFDKTDSFLPPLQKLTANAAQIVHGGQRRIGQTDLRVEEINGYITEITEIALEEENSKNYISFMKKNEQLYSELEKRIDTRIQSSADETNLRIEAISLKLNELAKTAKRPATEQYKLKDERKMITQSILETSRIQNSPKASSILRLRPQVSFGKTVTSSEELCEMSDTNSSLQAELDRTKLMEIEKQCKRCLQTWWVKVENALQGFKKQQQKLSVSCTQMSQKAQMKLEGNLESLWNVISDLCSRISKFESMELLSA